MKVKELIEILSTCDPETEITPTVARKVFVPTPNAPKTFSGEVHTTLTFKLISKGLSRQQAIRMCMLEQHTDPNVIFYKE